jgi:hypothetical protein
MIIYVLHRTNLIICQTSYSYVQFIFQFCYVLVGLKVTDQFKNSIKNYKVPEKMWYWFSLMGTYIKFVKDKVYVVPRLHKEVEDLKTWIRDVLTTINTCILGRTWVKIGILTGWSPCDTYCPHWIAMSVWKTMCMYASNKINFTHFTWQCTIFNLIVRMIKDFWPTLYYKTLVSLKTGKGNDKVTDSWAPSTRSPPDLSLSTHTRARTRAHTHSSHKGHLGSANVWLKTYVPNLQVKG